MAYAKRYAAGFNDSGIAGGTPADSQFLNAVEAALLKLFDTDPTIDGQVAQWIAASSKFGPALILNKNIDAAAAIAKSKLDLAGQITDADIAGAAAIAGSKIASLTPSKLVGYPSNAAQFLRGDGAWATAGSDWQAVSATLTYSSADGHTFVVTTGGVDLTGTIPLGARLRATHAAATKFFIVTAIDATTITLYGGTDYTLAATAITVPFFSQAKVPLGFPVSPLKWQEEFNDNLNRSQATPAQNTWYNIGTSTLAVPIGVWIVEYEVCLYYDTAGKEVEACLSNTNSTKSDPDMNVRSISVTGNTSPPVYRRKVYSFTSKTSLYLNARTQSAGAAGNIFFLGGDGSTIIRATSAYL